MGSTALAMKARRSFADDRPFAWCLLGTWLLTAATHYYVITPASVLGVVAGDLGTSEARAIWLVSAVPASWAVTNFVLGVWIDRLGDYRMIGIGTVIVVLAGIGSWWTALDGAFLPLMGTRLAAGVAVGVIWTASTNLIGGAVSAANRGTAIGVFLTSAPAGFALGQLSVPHVSAAVGWQSNFLLTGLAAGLAFALVTVGIRGLPVTPPTNTASVGANFSIVSEHRIVWYASAMAFAAYSYYLFMNSWLPSYLTEEFALSAELSGLLAAVFPAMGVLSRAGGGFISDRLLGQRRVPVLQAAFLVSLPLVVLIAGTRWLALIVAALVVAGFVIQLTFGVVYSYVQESVDADVSGTALAFVTTAGISGAFSAPIVAGELIELSGSYLLAFAYATVLTAMGLVVSVSAPESRRS
ncbi:nitrate/nitrite transporter [Halorubrum sp. F4]|uniref:MFS transporter n=1 Tax=Halorubrum sp. F4 TaxID=2989715 RepID=UPI0024813798|nr:MFS transporter [Halorubrum sp. F4]